MSSFDTVGDIAIVKFDERKTLTLKQKKKFALDLMKKVNRIKTVVEKVQRVSGRLRTIKIKHLLGEKNTLAVYKENGCNFKFNIETCYFSPRLSEERKKVYKMCKKGESILVLFAGVGPFPVVIAKNRPEVKKIVSIELGKEAAKFAFENSKINKVDKIIETLQGDVKRIIPQLIKRKEKFDRIIMARPNLKETFLKYALMVSKVGTIIHYHGFCREEELPKLLKQLDEEAKDFGKKIKVLFYEKAGDIAPLKFRWRIDIKVL